MPPQRARDIREPVPMRIPAREVLEKDSEVLQSLYIDHLKRCRCQAGDACPVRRAVTDAIGIIGDLMIMWEEAR